MRNTLDILHLVSRRLIVCGLISFGNLDVPLHCTIFEQTPKITPIIQPWTLSTLFILLIPLILHNLIIIITIHTIYTIILTNLSNLNNLLTLRSTPVALLIPSPSLSQRIILTRLNNRRSSLVIIIKVIERVIRGTMNGWQVLLVVEHEDGTLVGDLRAERGVAVGWCVRHGGLAVRRGVRMVMVAGLVVTYRVSREHVEYGD